MAGKIGQVWKVEGRELRAEDGWTQKLVNQFTEILDDEKFESFEDGRSTGHTEGYDEGYEDATEERA